jgi:hypothetical protein
MVRNAIGPQDFTPNRKLEMRRVSRSPRMPPPERTASIYPTPDEINALPEKSAAISTSG